MRCPQSGIRHHRVLHHEQDWLLQYLEGLEEALQAAMIRIGRDARHCDVRVLHSAPVTQRRFPDWQMVFVSGNQLALADLRQVDGGTLRSESEEPFDLVVFLASNADKLRERQAV